MFGDGKSALEGNSKKSWGEIKADGKLNKKKGSGRLAWWGSTKKKKASHFFGLKGRHRYSDQPSSQIRAICVASIAVGAKGEENQIAR